MQDTTVCYGHCVINRFSWVSQPAESREQPGGESSQKDPDAQQAYFLVPQCSRGKDQPMTKGAGASALENRMCPAYGFLGQGQLCAQHL